jgi:hypothetical protein
VLVKARSPIWQNPTDARKISEKMKEWEKANNVKEIAKPITHEQIARVPTRSLLTEASTRAATVAPMPGADINRPNPDGPTCSTFVAKIGTNRLYGAPNMAMT